MPSAPPRYPIALNLEGAPVLVVGGGAVAGRKVLRLLRSGAKVTLVSPAVTEELRALAEAGAIRWEARPFRAGDVAGRLLVFTATGNRATDQLVVMAARAVGTLVNSADQSCPGDFELPGLHEQGRLQVAVFTRGAAPGFAAKLAHEIGEELADGLGEYVSLLAEARAVLRARHPEDSRTRRAAFARGLESAEARQLAEAGEVEAARSVLWEAIGEPPPPSR